MDSDRRRQVGRLGALEQRARHDPKVYTSAGRKVFLDRFERDVDPEGVLPADERAARAKAARTAWMMRLAMKSAAKRRRAPNPHADSPDRRGDHATDGADDG